MPLLFNMLSRFVYGVTQSQTQLKRLSSSSSSRFVIAFLPYTHTLRVSQISYLASCSLLMLYAETTGSGGHSVDATGNFLVFILVVWGS